MRDICRPTWETDIRIRYNNKMSLELSRKRSLSSMISEISLPQSGIGFKMISKMFLIRADAACDIYGNRGKRGPFRATGLSPIGQRLAQSLDTFSFFRKIRIDNDILKQYNKKNHFACGSNDNL